MQQALTVTQINEYIRGKMDQDAFLSNVVILGEISNYKVYPSGHHYFTLKDDGAALKCVMFKGSAIRLRFKPDNGMKVIAMGKISVYPRDGAYQLYCTAMAMDGIGDLHAAFEQLKAKLGEQGLFDPVHKKPIPVYPKVIGIVTSSAGAAIHDMLRILRKRFPLTKVRLLPVRVQGAEAPGEIAAAIAYANAHHLADLLIVGRGGGSIEDLWAFNDERVAWAIFRSDIPVISAVGHEPDVTISDYVADLRAATPSNAAELAVPDKAVLLQNLDDVNQRMALTLSRRIKNIRQHLDILSQNAALKSPVSYMDQKRKNLMLLKTRMTGAQSGNVFRSKQKFLAAAAKLDAMSPLKVLTRGYAMTQDLSGNVIRSVKQLRAGEDIRVLFSDGSVNATINDLEVTSDGE